MWEELAKQVAIAIVGALGGVGIIVLFLVMNPDALDKWAAIFYRIAHKLFGVAHKRYLKHDIQAGVNGFTATLARAAPFMADTKVRVEWADTRTSRQAFLDNGQVIVRLRKQDRRDENFIHAAYLFIATGLLHNIKRYLSPSQRESIDLFVATKMLERQKDHLRSIFLDEYLLPRAAKSDKVSAILDCFANIDRAGLFFPAFVQELHFLGGKVFGKRQDTRVITEVTALSGFLETLANRKLGEEGERNFERDFCRVAVVIVGKQTKIFGGPSPWIDYIRGALLSKKIETIYLLGARRNKGTMDTIAAAFESSHEIYRTLRYRATLRDRDGDDFDADQYLVVLRLVGAPTIQPSGSAVA